MDPLEGKMNGTSSPENISTKLQRIAELAGKAPDMVITSLSHHIDYSFMAEAYRRTRKDAAPGVDGETAQEFELDLEANLQGLVDKLKSGKYRAPSVRRVYIPKGDGKTRPIGIPTFSDKVMQRAVTMVLEALYEQDFLNCSYGFRPGRSAHDALQELWKGLMGLGGGAVLDVDVEGYFDNIDHGHLRSFLDLRVRDGVIRRAIDKWLKAGVMEGGGVSYPGVGTPQGGVISPLLANIYLHEALDKWFDKEVKPRLRDKAFLIRYADDFVIVCRNPQDAERVMNVLPKRLGKYGLQLHPDKTRVVDFRRPPQGGGRGDTFDLLGFTHYWGKSRKGQPVVKRKTAKDRFSRALKRTSDWCRANRHQKVAEQHKVLSSKLRGHYNYYGITGNYEALSRFLFEVCKIWRKWLDRRSQRRKMKWERFNKLLEKYKLPPAVCAASIYRKAANP